jgi:hypothetical protein
MYYMRTRYISVGKDEFIDIGMVCGPISAFPETMMFKGIVAKPNGGICTKLELYSASIPGVGGQCGNNGSGTVTGLPSLPIGNVGCGPSLIARST